MSVSESGKRIMCDGPGCKAWVAVIEGADTTAALDGWSAVLEEDEWRHYCPRCWAQICAQQEPSKRQTED